MMSLGACGCWLYIIRLCFLRLDVPLAAMLYVVHVCSDATNQDLAEAVVN